jgi:hypothetical protein
MNENQPFFFIYITSGILLQQLKADLQDRYKLILSDCFPLGRIKIINNSEAWGTSREEIRRQAWEPRMVSHTCNPSTQEAEAGGL